MIGLVPRMSKEDASQMAGSIQVPGNLSVTDSHLSLDEQYLDFRARTDHIFARYPRLEPMRYSVFKELLIQRKSMGLWGYVKHWIRPIVRNRGSECEASEAKVLIWIESSREVIADALIPVYRELTSNGIKVTLVSCGGPGELPPSVVRFRAAAHARTPAWAKEAWSMLCDELPGIASPRTRRFFFCAAANAEGLIQEIDRILDKVKPETVVTASTQLPGGSALMVAAHARRIQSVLLQHGVLQAFYTPVLADQMLTWGDSSDRVLWRLGVRRDQTVSLGSPRHDSMKPSAKADARGALLKTLSLPDRPTLVFFSNGNDLIRNGRAPLECSRWLEATAEQYREDVNIVIRLHPNEDRALYRGCRHLHLTKGVPDLATTLAGCDWVGSLCSTVMYDALLYKKPVWHFFADDWPDLADNWRQGLAERISSESDLKDRIGRTLREPRASVVDEGLADRVFVNHGSAACAVADFVVRKLKSSISQSPCAYS